MATVSNPGTAGGDRCDPPTSNSRGLPFSSVNANRAAGESDAREMTV